MSDANRITIVNHGMINFGTVNIGVGETQGRNNTGAESIQSTTGGGHGNANAQSGYQQGGTSQHTTTTGHSTNQRASAHQGALSHQGHSAHQGASAYQGHSANQGASAHQGHSAHQGASANQGNSANQGASAHQGHSAYQGASAYQGHSAHQGASAHQGHSANLGASAHQGHSANLGASSHQGQSAYQGASAYQGHSAHQGASAHQGHSSNLGASAHQGHSANLGASAHQGNSPNLGASSHPGYSANMGSFAHQGHSANLGASTHNGHSAYQGASAHQRHSANLEASAHQGPTDSEDYPLCDRNHNFQTASGIEVNMGQSRGQRNPSSETDTFLKTNIFHSGYGCSNECDKIYFLCVLIALHLYQEKSYKNKSDTQLKTNNFQSQMSQNADTDKVEDELHDGQVMQLYMKKTTGRQKVDSLTGENKRSTAHNHTATSCFERIASDSTSIDAHTDTGAYTSRLGGYKQYINKEYYFDTEIAPAEEKSETHVACSQVATGAHGREDLRTRNPMHSSLTSQRGGKPPNQRPPAETPAWLCAATSHKPTRDDKLGATSAQAAPIKVSSEVADDYATQYIPTASDLNATIPEISNDLQHASTEGFSVTSDETTTNYSQNATRGDSSVIIQGSTSPSSLISMPGQEHRISLTENDITQSGTCSSLDIQELDVGSLPGLNYCVNRPPPSNSPVEPLRTGPRSLSLTHHPASQPASYDVQPHTRLTATTISGELRTDTLNLPPRDFTLGAPQGRRVHDDYEPD